MLTDTTPEADALRLQLLRQAPVWRKLQLMAQLNDMTRPPSARIVFGPTIWPEFTSAVESREWACLLLCKWSIIMLKE